MQKFLQGTWTIFDIGGTNNLLLCSFIYSWEKESKSNNNWPKTPLVTHISKYQMVQTTFLFHPVNNPIYKNAGSLRVLVREECKSSPGFQPHLGHLVTTS